MLTRERPSFVPTRRNLAGMLAATAALAVPAAVAGAAQTEPDAELIALGRQLEAAWIIENRVCIEIRDDESDAGQAKLDEAFDRCADIAHRIEALTATTLAGLRAKLQALDWTRNGDALDVEELFGPGNGSTDLRLVVAILADIRAAA